MNIWFEIRKILHHPETIHDCKCLDQFNENVWELLSEKEELREFVEEHKDHYLMMQEIDGRVDSDFPVNVQELMDGFEIDASTAINIAFELSTSVEMIGGNYEISETITVPHGSSMKAERCDISSAPGAKIDPMVKFEGMPRFGNGGSTLRNCVFKGVGVMMK